ncbi:MAG: PilX N-terminal domain-containing pilus assembly protein [Pseudomonadota bacterium]
MTILNKRNQSGAALVTALVLLTIMTVLAITSMSTNTLEEKMAANAQEMNRAFQLAESGLQIALADGNAFDYTNLVNDQGTFDKADDVYDYTPVPLDETDLGTSYEADITYRAWFREEKNTIARGRRGWDVGKVYFFFDLQSTGNTRATSATVSAGAYQVGPD